MKTYIKGNRQFYCYLLAVHIKSDFFINLYLKDAPLHNTLSDKSHSDQTFCGHHLSSQMACNLSRVASQLVPPN